jgi:hypothetical protein
LLSAFSLSYGENPIFHIIVKAQASPVYLVAFGQIRQDFRPEAFFFEKNLKKFPE